MIKLEWLAVAALAGGGVLCPLCDSALAGAGETGLRTPAASAAALAAAAAPVADTAQVRFAVSGMTCGSCAMTARIALRRMEGVYRAEVSFDSATAVVWYDPVRTSPESVIAKLRDMTGYEARVLAQTERPKETP